METKILKAVFGGSRYTVAAKRTRTDYGQVLEISGVDLPETFECIFSNSSTSAGTGKKMIGSNQRCLIPDEYLKTGQPIYAWILLHDSEDDGRHMYSIKIPVDDMPDTSPEEPTPVEQSVISQAITALNAAVDTTTQKAQEASESADRAEQAADGIEAYVERAESAQQAAESARDKAEEAKASAQESATATTEGLNEVRYWADIINKAYVKIDDWTQIAYGASQQAIASEQASTESARQASQSAETANTKAEEASGFAQTASQKALEATQSASTAVQAKTDAESAKTASQTAQGLAESARDGAVSAKTGAESARDEAQSIANGISGKVEQIDSNTERIESLEDDRYKPYPTDTASGSVASFPDGADGIPLKSCIVQVEPVQEGSGDPSPDNVRPISGFTGCEVQRTGKNLLDDRLIDDGFMFTKAGAKNASVNPMRSCIKIPVKPNTTYFVKAPRYENVWNVVYFGKDGTGLGIAVKVPSGMSGTAFTTPDDCFFVGLNMLTSDKETIALNYPATATDYEPYQGQTIPINWQTEAGMVYGGTLDVTTGVLTVDRAMVDLGTLNWTYRDSFAGFSAQLSPTAKDKFNAVCSAYLYGGAYFDLSDKQCGYIYFNQVFVKDSSYTDAATFKTAMSGVQLVYELATPITYQLTPTEIRSLLGQNNVFADTGDSAVEYRADTKLYIEKLTQPEEDDMIADSAINSGQFFMVGNSLYHALANIASGATITVGTNAQRVSLSDALNLVNA